MNLAMMLGLRHRPAADPPAQLFSAGEKGWRHEAWDFSTLFQDALWTTPVTATGQNVRSMLDKSGRGIHVSKATGSAHPVLQVDGGHYYLDWSASDGPLVSAPFDLSAHTICHVWAGVRKLNDTLRKTIFETQGATFTGAFELSQSLGSGDNFFAQIYHVNDKGGISAIGYSAPSTAVISLRYAAAASIRSEIVTDLRINGASPSSQSSVGETAAGLAGFANNLVLRYGRDIQGEGIFAGRLYGCIARCATTSSPLVQEIETWLNGKTGAY